MLLQDLVKQVCVFVCVCAHGCLSICLYVFVYMYVCNIPEHAEQWVMRLKRSSQTGVCVCVRVHVCV